MEGTGSGFFRFQNRLSSTWSVNENNVSADHQEEVDLTLRLGLDLPEENQEAPAQGVTLQSFSNNIKIPTLHHQGMENSEEILQNAGEGLERKLDHKPWPLPVLNLLSNNWNNISGNSVIRQQQQQKKKRCTTCQKTDTPLWRKGPDGPRTLCNGCGLRYARDTCRGTEFPSRSTTIKPPFSPSTINSFPCRYMAVNTRSQPPSPGGYGSRKSQSHNPKRP